MSDSLPPARRRPNLVVLRAGRESLHRQWLGETQSFDLAISSFSSKNPDDYPEARYFDFYEGGKWDGIFQFFARNPGLTHDYDYVWLPDDDIAASAADINRMFELAGQYGLELTQPSLTPESFFWHPMTLRCPLTRIRYTNFVEVMVPVLRADLLRKALPYFESTKSGWGVDHLWSRLTTDPRNKCAILDEVSVHHTRPVGSALAKKMKSEGQSGASEMDQLSAVFDVHGARPICFRAITRAGVTVRGPVLCGLLQFFAQAPWRTRGRHWRSGPRVFLGSLYSHLTGRPDFSILSAPVAHPAQPSR